MDKRLHFRACILLPNVAGWVGGAVVWREKEKECGNYPIICDFRGCGRLNARGVFGCFMYGLCGLVERCKISC